MLRARPVRALTVGNLNIVCGIVTLLTVQTNFHHRSCARCARTGGTGHPLCPKRSMNTGLGQPRPSPGSSTGTHAAGWRLRMTIRIMRRTGPQDFVERNFTATRPNQPWLADLTYVATWRD